MSDILCKQVCVCIHLYFYRYWEVLSVVNSILKSVLFRIRFPRVGTSAQVAWLVGLTMPH